MDLRRTMLLVLLLAAVAVGHRLHAPTPAPPPAAAPATAPAVPDLTGLPLHAASRPARAVPRYDPQGLPSPQDESTPVDALAARADAGDARAACRLAAEMSMCDEALMLAEEHPRCRALFERHAARRFSWLRQAAFAGEPEAMLRYGLGEGFGAVVGESYAFLGTPDFDTWRREAPSMLQAVFEAGYPEAAIHLLFAQDPLFGGHVAALLPPDPLRERARLELLVLLMGDTADAAQMAAMYPAPDPRLGQDARALALRWHDEHFDGLVLAPRRKVTLNRLPLMRASGQACSQPLPGLSP